MIAARTLQAGGLVTVYGGCGGPVRRTRPYPPLAMMPRMRARDAARPPIKPIGTSMMRRCREE